MTPGITSSALKTPKHTFVMPEMIQNTGLDDKPPAGEGWKYLLICRDTRADDGCNFYTTVEGATEDEADRLLAEFSDRPDVTILPESYSDD